jgi:hypothetical protein
MVTVDVEPGQGKPPRKLYSLTESGREALQAWLQEAASSELSTKAFVRQLVMAGNLSKDDLRAHLLRRRSQVAEYLARPADSQNSHEDHCKGPGHRLVHDYGSAIANAELEWLDAQLAELG